MRSQLLLRRLPCTARTAAFAGSLLISRAANAQTLQQESQIRVGATGEKKLVKDLRLVVSPEVRTDGFNPDRYLLELGLKYSPFDYLSLRSGLRGDAEEKKDGTEFGYRAKFDIVGSLKLADFEPNARLRYTHGFGPRRDTENRLRYLLGLDYEIDKADVTLGASAEVFHNLDTGPIYKMRYALGASYKFYRTKKIDQWVSAGYMLDYFLTESRNVHIVELAYKIVL